MTCGIYNLKKRTLSNSLFQAINEKTPKLPLLIACPTQSNRFHVLRPRHSQILKWYLPPPRLAPSSFAIPSESLFLPQLSHPHYTHPLPISSLILRHTLWRRSISSTATILTTMHHMTLLSMTLPTVCNKPLHVLPVLDILPEIAYMAADFVVGFEGEGDEGNEAPISLAY